VKWDLGVSIPKERKAMKNKLKLLTVILTIVFSFAVTTVVWAECDVAISPSVAVILPGESLTFVAETTCDRVVQTATSYTWEISEMGCTGSSIHPDTGAYTSGAEDNPCEDIIMVTDSANSGITAIAVVDVADCLPSVDISGPLDVFPPCPASATYTAETTVCDIVSGTYTWELDGEPAGTGDSFEVTCFEGGIKVLTVTDIANGNITDSIGIECLCPRDIIEATFEGCGTRLIPWFGVVEIFSGFDFGLTDIVEYDSPLVFKLPKLLNRRNQTIIQFVILLPSILFPAWDYPAQIEVAVYGKLVYGFSNTIEIPACGQ